MPDQDTFDTAGALVRAATRVIPRPLDQAPGTVADAAPNQVPVDATISLIGGTGGVVLSRRPIICLLAVRTRTVGFHGFSRF